jgi:hypothetical protein
MEIKTPRLDLEWASNTNFASTASGEYDGEATKVDAEPGIRANGFVPEEPIAVEHVNHEIGAGHENTLSVLQRLWFGTKVLDSTDVTVPFHAVPVYGVQE